MNLLIADDELVIRNGLVSLDWEKIGITEVYSARNGMEAKELLLSEPIDIVIFDIRMPGMTGLELAAMVKEYSMDTAVILLTGFSEFSYAQEALRSGVSDYLLKPFHPRDIVKTVESVKKKLEKDRYLRNLAREHEDTKGAFDTLSQVRNTFPKVSQIVENILEDIARDFNEPLSLGIFAQRYHFSNNYISKRMKQETGYSFMDILLAVRVMNAAKLLYEGEKVNKAAQQTGFNDQHYFSQVFRRAFGCSPTDFKKQENDMQNIKLLPVLNSMCGKAGQ